MHKNIFSTSAICSRTMRHWIILILCVKFATHSIPYDGYHYDTNDADMRS